MPVETRHRGDCWGRVRKAKDEQQGRRTVGARLWAIVSLASGVALAVVLVAFLVRNGIFLVIGLVGLALSVVGGWWVVAERMPRRAVGFLALLLGAVVQVVALLRAGNEDLTSLLLLFVGSRFLPLPSWRRRRRSTRTCAEWESPTCIMHSDPDMRCCSAIRGPAAARSRSSASWARPTRSASRRSCSTTGSASKRWLGAPCPKAPTASAWRVVTAPRRSWRPSPCSTTFRSCASRREPETILRSISASTAATRARASMLSPTPSSAVWTTPPSTAASS